MASLHFARQILLHVYFCVMSMFHAIQSLNMWHIAFFDSENELMSVKGVIIMALGY